MRSSAPVATSQTVHGGSSRVQPRRQRRQHPEAGRVVVGARRRRDGVGVRHHHAQAAAAARPHADHVARAPARRREALHAHRQPRARRSASPRAPCARCSSRPPPAAARRATPTPRSCAPRSRAPPARQPPARRRATQNAPRRLITAGTVLSRIARSRPDRPALQVEEVEPHEVVEVELRAARHLPQAGDPGQHEVALLVPLLELVEVALRERPRADQRHLAGDHVEQLRQLVERVAAQEAADARQPRVVADLEQRAGGLVDRLEVGLHLVGVAAHGPELQARERLAADPRAHRAVEDRPARGDRDGDRDQQQQRAQQHDQQQRARRSRTCA